jgi:hypothetical protein
MDQLVEEHFTELTTLNEDFMQGEGKEEGREREWEGKAWHGTAWHGSMAWHGKERKGKGKERKGKGRKDLTTI